MTGNSGNDPFDPPIGPSQPAHEPQPASNGPFFERLSTGQLSGQIATALPPVERDRKTPEQKDAFRETVETVVFVVVLVLLLKAFMAEAFVIPTGSMATTLLGYHRVVECPECGFRFPLNLSDEKEQGRIITGCTCPNCRLHIDATNSNQFPQ
jgi:Signal peptidase, peptidase S26